MMSIEGKIDLKNQIKSFRFFLHYKNIFLYLVYLLQINQYYFHERSIVFVLLSFWKNCIKVV